jgi:hypothetical protein
MSLLLYCRMIADMDIMLLSLKTTTTEYDPIVPLVFNRPGSSNHPMLLWWQ